MSAYRESILNWKEIEFMELSLKRDFDKLVLFCRCLIGNDIIDLSFYNISRMRFGELSNPLIIQGLCIVDHSQNGWENESRYEICDFEDNRIHFYCEFFRSSKVERTEHECYDK